MRNLPTTKRIAQKDALQTVNSPCAGGGHFVTFIPFRLALPMVAVKYLASIGRHNRYTHGVT